MNESPRLIEISKNVYGCSECADFKLEIVRPDLKTPEFLDKWVAQESLDHLKRRHSGEDASKAAVRL